MQTITETISKTHYQLLAGGLLCILIANLFDLQLLKVDVDEALANLGVLIFLIGGIQWIFDATTRKKLYEEISLLTLSNVRIGTSGIEDVRENSREVDYRDVIHNSSQLIIGLNYSPRIIEDCFDDFLNRCRDGKTTTLLIVDPDSDAGAWLMKNEEECSHIRPNLEKIMRIRSDLNGEGAERFKVLSHTEVLHYSFVLADDCVWIKPYRNSRGRAKAPALKVKAGTVLFDHFHTDISQLVNKSSA